MKTMLLKILARFVLMSEETISIFERLKFMMWSLVTFAPIAYSLNFFDLWIRDNEQFSFFVSLSLLINAVVGAVQHLANRSFCFREFLLGNFLMAFVVICGALTLDMLRMTIGDNMMGDGFRILLQVTTLLYPGSKIMKNIFILTKGSFPPKHIMERVYNFEKNGDLKALFSKEALPAEEVEEVEEYINE